VSPYVTECPYCGTRLRKRAPKLERVGDEVRVREDRKTRRLKRSAKRRRRFAARRAFSEELTTRPVVTVAAILVPSLLVIVERASNLGVFDLGAITAGLADADWWRYLAAPFVYDDVGYLFACGLAFAIFLPPLERRLGSVATALLVIGCGALSMLAAVGIDKSFGDGVLIAAGGNGIALGALAAYAVIRDAERRADPTVEYDRIALAVAAVVLLLLPVVEDFADFWAGLAGGLLGAACGLAAALGGRTSDG
jgi:membrane associated rhomboid family serine protease